MLSEFYETSNRTGAIAKNWFVFCLNCQLIFCTNTIISVPGVLQHESSQETLLNTAGNRQNGRINGLSRQPSRDQHMSLRALDDLIAFVCVSAELITV